MSFLERFGLLFFGERRKFKENDRLTFFRPLPGKGFAENLPMGRPPSSVSNSPRSIYRLQNRESSSGRHNQPTDSLTWSTLVASLRQKLLNSSLYRVKPFRVYFGTRQTDCGAITV